MKTFFERAYTFLVSQRRNIILLFKVYYLAIVIFIFTVLFLLKKGDNELLSLFVLGTKFGEVSLIAYVLTLLPGMATRIGFKNNTISLLRIYRRYIGISMFLLALTHMILVKAIFATSLSALLPAAPFEAMGGIAISILFFMFMTSNDISIRLLRSKWYLIQNLTNIVMFFILFHLALVKVSQWTVLAGLLVLSQIITFIVSYRRKRSSLPNHQAP